MGGRFALRLRDDGWHVSAIVREASQFFSARSLGSSPILLGEELQLNHAIQTADAVLVTAPPAENGCPALTSMRSTLPAGNQARWLGYLSSTSVYGDQQCRLTDETAELKATSAEGRTRLGAEQAWKAFANTERLPLNIFRLAAIYGPERSAIDRVKTGTARRVIKQDHVLSRVHVDDIVELLSLSIEKCDRSETYNVSDDEPSPPQDVVAPASRLLNLPPPPEEAIEDAQMNASAMRFFSDCRRISSLRAQQ